MFLMLTKRAMVGMQFLVRWLDARFREAFAADCFCPDLFKLAISNRESRFASGNVGIIVLVMDYVAVAERGAED